MLEPEAVATLCQPVFEAEPRLRAAFLFGSVARGQARADSDVDIAVVGRELDVLSLSASLSLRLHHEVDVVEVDPEAPIPLLRAILRDGHRLYEQRPGAAAEFISRVHTVLDLDGPGYDRMASAFLKRVSQRGVGI